MVKRRERGKERNGGVQEEGTKIDKEGGRQKKEERGDTERIREKEGERRNN